MEIRHCATLLLIAVFTLSVASIFVGCEQRLLVDMKADGMKEDESGPIKVAGIGESRPGVLYIFGTIIVQYDKETWEQADKKHIPITAVNDFLVSKGYTPKVRGRSSAKLVEVVDIDKNVDPLPLLEELQTVPGVVSAELNDLNEYTALLMKDNLPRVAGESEIRPLTPNKVGKMEDRWLFELGVLLVTYDMTTPLVSPGAPVVAVFQLLSDKGYKPIEKDVFLPAKMQVVDIGENINPLLLFEELKTVTGVIGVQLNILYESADILLGKITVPGMSGIE